MHSSRMRTAHGSSHPQGGEGLPQCMLGNTPPPGVGLETLPPGVGLENHPPWLDPSISPLGVGLETLPPGDLQGMLRCWDTTCNACWNTTPPPPHAWTEFLTHATENITLPQTSFAGGKNFVVSSMVGQIGATHSLHLYFSQH